MWYVVGVFMLLYLVGGTRLRLWLLALLFVALVLMPSCRRQDWITGVDSGDPREDFMIAENDRAARLLGEKVEGHVTDKLYMTTCSDGEQCPAAGWYSGGHAYYWRRYVLHLSKTPSELTALAAHEVCHAREYQHGDRHTDCTLDLLEKMNEEAR